jgi:hypothetical protein
MEAKKRRLSSFIFERNLFEEDMSIKVTFPFTITREIVDKLIKKPEINQSFYMLYT